jgi:hypothetical protein
MDIEKQNQKLGQLLLDLNHDLESRANHEIRVSLLEVIMYLLVGGFAFIIFMGILKALLCRLPG